MKTFLLSAAAVLSISLGSGAQIARAQTAPKPKSNDEIAAINAMYKATTPDEQIAAANSLLDKFADTEFKSIAYQLIAQDYQRKGDFAKAVVFGERSLETDPKNYQAELILAGEYARNTHDTDFDKEDKLKKAEKYANDAIANIATATKPNPAVTDAQWDGAKKDFTASAHEALGLAALVRKNPQMAQSEFKAAAEGAADADPAEFVRLALADNMLGKYDEAIAAADKAISLPNAGPQVKSAAEEQKTRATQLKNKPPAAAPTPAPKP